MTFRWKSRFDYQGTHRRPGMKTEKPFVERSPITSRKLASNIALAAAITSSYTADLSTQREEREREREQSATVSSARTLAPLLETIVSGQFMISSSSPFCSFFSPLSFSICATYVTHLTGLYFCLRVCSCRFTCCIAADQMGTKSRQRKVIISSPTNLITLSQICLPIDSFRWRRCMSAC